MNSGDTKVGVDKMDDTFWENILKNFNNTETITDFQTLQNIANQVYYIHPERCMLEYGMTESNGSVDRSNMPDSGNKYTDNSQRLYIFKQTVDNYRHIWDKLDNREKNFVYTCVCGGYVDTLGLFFLNRLQRNNMVESQDKYLDNLLIDLDTLSLTDFPDQYNSPYQSEGFELPDAYDSNLDGDQFDSNLNNDQFDEFPTLETQFEECQRIHNDVQEKIDKNDKNKQDILWEIWEKVVEKKNENDPEALIQLQQKMLNLPYSS